MNIDLFLEKTLAAAERTNMLLEQLLAAVTNQQPASAPAAQAHQDAAPVAPKATAAKAPAAKTDPSDSDKSAILAVLVENRAAFTHLGSDASKRAAVQEICRKYSAGKLADCGSVSAVRSCVAELRAAYPEAWA